MNNVSICTMLEWKKCQENVVRKMFAIAARKLLRFWVNASFVARHIDSEENTAQHMTSNATHVCGKITRAMSAGIRNGLIC